VLELAEVRPTRHYLYNIEQSGASRNPDVSERVTGFRRHSGLGR